MSGLHQLQVHYSWTPSANKVDYQLEPSAHSILLKCSTKYRNLTFSMSYKQFSQKMEVISYFSKISLHGFQYLTDREVGNCQKLFWVIVIACCVSLLIMLSVNLEKEFLARNTKVVLDDTHASLSEVKFPGVVICSGNQVRRSFIEWIVENLKKLGHPNESDELIKSMIFKSFYGSNVPLTNHEKGLLEDLLNADFLKDYFKIFVRSLNVSAIDVFPDATLLVQPNIISSEFSINDKKMVESYFTKMSGQWKYDQRFVSIKWFGNVENRDKKSTIKIDPVKFTSKGICSWLGPLTKEDDEHLFTWPSGVVSGNIERAIVTSYSFSLHEKYLKSNNF